MLNAIACVGFVFVSSVAGAEVTPDFSGSWSVDLRTPHEKQNNVECGVATFDLVQTKSSISGSHSFYTPGCGRLNEGGEGTVTGNVKGSIATLTVTSGRTGAVYVGTAKLQGNTIAWATSKQLRSGEPEGESPLVLQNGTLIRAIK